MPEEFTAIGFDNDSYLNYLSDESSEPPFPPGSIPDLSPWEEVRERQSLIYFVLRSVAILGSAADEAAVQAHRQWRRSALDRALRLHWWTEEGHPLPLPTWAEETVVQVRDHLRPAFPRVDDIEVVVTLDPRLYVRAHHSTRQIRLSLVTRQLWHTIDLLLWNAVSVRQELIRTIGSNAALPNPSYEVLLPFLLPLYRNVRWDQIPMMRIRSELAGGGAVNAARIQMTFMIAHEFAHLLLHEKGRSGPDLEAEADRFAYDVLFRNPVENIPLGDIWMAIRWLFEILAVEKLLAWRLAGEEGTFAVTEPPQQTLIHPFVRSAGPSSTDIVLGGAGLYVIQSMRRQLAAASAQAVRQSAARWESTLTSEEANRPPAHASPMFPDPSPEV
ncbi:ImmA/IrrE family metallo-endopeptidase [Streptomyces sp. NPDC047917]|uniref:ImmA/IrrE family metallo-endopeptidase n=1 Tax=Streptomyces sp. NPDC047917 TaxID=3365491 RepID=UPI00372366A4